MIVTLAALISNALKLSLVFWPCLPQPKRDASPVRAPCTRNLTMPLALDDQALQVLKDLSYPIDPPLREPFLEAL
jgi:hypothetical protein